ncbi:cytochrome P450 [Pseudoprimorskyibacter insulae]|uniref:Polyketide biosynthesis cytochrome P450 PksS n=1 Tax=Pseudoprimorskyibacter insulae TaxID=1695997 RepID=A0A2R8AWV3_9RHOB|nr:cytochrome P450 [Pseudoprimorskyibacter insulae]SPF80478.1 Polyketide biosynthesis cytochrome P450 PksS [Pseudoprimorskyibacter insulae]
MQRFSQSPTDPDFVHSPYPAYDRMRAMGPMVWWDDYAMPCATDHATVQALFRDKRFGREVPPELAKPHPAHLAPFYAVEAHSMLELEPPRHTRLRGLVLRAFTSRRIAALAPEISTLSHQLIDALPDGPFDALAQFAQHLPVIIIARLLGVPEAMAPQLLQWSNAMVAVYQARRDTALELAAAQAASDFSEFLRGYVATRRNAPQDDLISHLIAAEEDGQRLNADELITTCILLLNAGHEATVHTIGNGIKALLEAGQTVTQDNASAVAEEIMRFDPPLHMFTRYAYADVTLHGHSLKRGDQVALLLGAANRDPSVYPDPHRFDPTRAMPAHTAFGGGIHFCVGAPLARLELQIALPILFERLPNLRIVEPPRYANLYHFHGLERLMLSNDA